MAFTLHPILEAGQAPKAGVWYAISPEDATESPTARVGACATFIRGEGGGAVVISAGATPEGPLSDLYELRFCKAPFKWSVLPSKGLPPRYEHAAFSVDDELGVFGGAVQSGPLNDVWRYSRAVGEWLVVPAKGVAPYPRTYHTSSCLWRGRCLVVFSGGATGSTPVADDRVYLLESASPEWSSPPTSGGPPPPRQGHISVVIGNRLIVHGGMAEESIFNDLWNLDLATWKWSEVSSPTPLPALAAHGCAVIDRKLYMFGGLGPEGASDQLYCLDTDTMHCERVAISGPPPPSRLDHSMCTVEIPVAKETTHEGNKRMDTGPNLARHSTESTATAAMVTILSPEQLGGAEAGVCEDGQQRAGDTTEDKEVLGRQTEMGVMEGGGVWETVKALFVFGGMDTEGTLHSDCFVLVPPAQ